MKQFIIYALSRLLRKLEKEPKAHSVVVEKTKAIDEVSEQTIEKLHIADQAEPTELKPKKVKGQKLKTLTPEEKAVRDITEMMEVPFLALSKNRKSPIIYEKHDGPNMIRVKVSRHTGHFLASIYDWDIILFVAGKMQEILNVGSDIPPRTMIIPRHEILRALKKHDGKKQELDLKASLSRLQLTGIETTIRNEDGRYDAGFGFLESWSYTKRKDIREIEITLSKWLYEGICAKGSLLMVDPDYFDITTPEDLYALHNASFTQIKQVNSIKLRRFKDLKMLGYGQPPYVTLTAEVARNPVAWMHEFGHSLGLEHRDDSVNNLMFSAEEKAPMTAPGWEINRADRPAFER